MEHNTTDKAAILAGVYLQNRSEHFIEAHLPKRGCIIDAFLDTLSVENRIIFMRRYAYFDTYAEIANRVGLSEKNVSVRLARIRRKMKKYLMERKVFV